MPNDNSPAPDRVLLVPEVATAFRVCPKTVTKWVRAGRIPAFRTPGGHLRFRKAEISALLQPEPRP